MSLPSEYYRGTYRIPSNRLRGWNYSANSHYFITIVTHNREYLFGKIVDGKMVLNKIGEIAYEEFIKSFIIREELFIGNFVFMPNHLHAIVILDNTGNGGTVNTLPIETSCKHIVPYHRVREKREYPGETHGSASLQSSIHPGKTHGSASLQSSIHPGETHGSASLQREGNSISSFVAGFKAAAINRVDDWIDGENIQMMKYGKNNPMWQTNYYDHIIRSQEEYRGIVEYIVDNPANWGNDMLLQPISNHWKMPR